MKHILTLLLTAFLAQSAFADAETPTCDDFVPGRFQLLFGPVPSGGVFLIDTATGRVWDFWNDRAQRREFRETPIRKEAKD